MEPTHTPAPDASTCKPPRLHQAATSRPTGDDLRQVFEHKADYLRGVLRGYVSKFGLASGAQVDEAALEVLSDTFEQAHRSLHLFDPALSPSGTLLPWLQGIALNIVKNRLRQKSRARETSVSQLTSTHLPGEAREESEALDYLMGLPDQEPIGARLEAQAGLDEMLSLVSPDDAQVLRLFFEEELDGAAIARRLSISHDAARQRQHRALNRLKREVTRQPTAQPAGCSRFGSASYGR